MNLNHKFLIALACIAMAVSSCDNKSELQKIQDKYNRQIDSLNIVIDSLSMENIRKDSSIMKKDSLVNVYQEKIIQYKDVIKEYKTVLYAIVGEDGMYHYGDIDYE